MRIKTMVVIFITVLLTVILMQNTEAVKFSFLFSTFYLSKLVMLTAVSVAGWPPKKSAQHQRRLPGRRSHQR
jgi:uncharacterized integral membrane protein